jgi:hypothetical protein
MKVTVNRALALTKAINSRIADLSTLRSEVASSETFFGAKESKKEPNYDVKAVDHQLVVLKRMLFEIDSRIKESNAVTQIDVAVDEDLIFRNLE